MFGARDLWDLCRFHPLLPFVYETGTHIFVHAGLDSDLPDWHETTDYQKV